MIRTLAIAIIAVSFFVSAAGQTGDVQDRNQEAVRQYKEHINSGDAKAAAADWVEDAQTFGRPTTRAGVQHVLEDIFVTFPDWHMEIQAIVSHGDAVIVHSRVSGTHRGVGKLAVNGGMLVGVQPTGKRFEVSAVHWYKLREGKLAEGFGVRDDLGMMQQLGLVPPVAEQTQVNPEEEIRQLILKGIERFNRHEVGTSAGFIPDADFVNVEGVWMRNRDEINRVHTKASTTWLKDAKIKLIELKIRFVKPDVVIVRQLHEMTGSRSPSGEELPPHRQISMRVLVKENGKWSTTAFQNTKEIATEAAALNKILNGAPAEKSANPTNGRRVVDAADSRLYLEQQIRKLDAEEANGLLNKDIAVLEKLWARDFTVNNPRNSISDGRDVVIGLIKDGTIDYASFDRQIEKMFFHGDTVITMGLETIKPVGKAPFAGQTVRRRYTHFWMKRDGKWLLTARHANVLCQ